MTVLKNGELYLYGFVGDSFWGDGFTASEVIDALMEIGPGDVTVHINSGGGLTDDGVSIYNALKAHEGKVTVIIDAMAASSASLIAMAGDERIMCEGAEMMIHEATGGTYGSAADHETSAKRLDKFGGQMAGIYARTTGGDVEEIRTEMKATLWMTPQEALERGFATAANDTPACDVAAFDYRIYAHAPERLCALAKSNTWTLEADRLKRVAASATAITGQQGVSKLPKQNLADEGAANNPPIAQPDVNAVGADAVAADRKRRKAVLSLDEAKGREMLAEELLDTEMSVERIQAMLAKAPAPVSASAADAETYESSRSAASALAQPGGQSKRKAGIDRTAIFAIRSAQQKG